MRKRELRVLVFVLGIILVGIMIFLFLLKGKTIESGENPKVDRADNVVCESSSIRYAFLEPKLDETEFRTKIEMIFEEGEMEVIGLQYETYYKDNERANEAYQFLMPELNLLMEEKGIDENFMLNTKFTRSDNKVLMSLFSKKEGLTKENEVLLMIYSEEGIILDRNELVENYSEKGFNCQ